MFCSNCGSECADNAIVCVKCGVATAKFLNPTAKSRLIAGLLQLFLGYFGAGRFYLGYHNIAVAQIIVVFFTCGIGTIWPIIDGIMMIAGSVATDAQGKPLRD